MMLMPVVILSGGLGERVKSISGNKPKCMIDFLGKPFLHWQLELLARNGFSYVVLCLGHKSEQIIEFLDKAKPFGLEVDFSLEKRQLGTGGAILNSFEFLPDEFFVLYGDSYVFLNFNSVNTSFSASRKLGLMTVIRGDNSREESNVKFSDNLVEKYEKPPKSLDLDFVDYGCTILSKRAFEGYAKGSTFDISEIYSRLAANRELIGYEVTQRYHEIGSLVGVKEFRSYLEQTSSGKD